jgi:hypothetical protein
MSVLIRFAPASMTVEQYEEARRRLDEAGYWPPDGMEYHVCFGAGDKMRVSEIWDSQEQLAAFGERLQPVLADVGIDTGEPEIVEVHAVVRR